MKNVFVLITFCRKIAHPKIDTFVYMPHRGGKRSLYNTQLWTTKTIFTPAIGVRVIIQRFAWRHILECLENAFDCLVVIPKIGTINNCRHSNIAFSIGMLFWCKTNGKSFKNFWAILLAWRERMSEELKQIRLLIRADDLFRCDFVRKRKVLNVTEVYSIQWVALRGLGFVQRSKCLKGRKLKGKAEKTNWARNFGRKPSFQGQFLNFSVPF